jgi:hypothetical protein
VRDDGVKTAAFGKSLWQRLCAYARDLGQAARSQTILDLLKPLVASVVSPESIGRYESPASGCKSKLALNSATGPVHKGVEPYQTPVCLGKCTKMSVILDSFLMRMCFSYSLAIYRLKYNISDKVASI